MRQLRCSVRPLALVLATALAIAVASCGGSGGPAADAGGDSTWGSLIWGNDTWQAAP